MLSRTSRQLTYLTAGFYAALGAALYLLPGQMAPVFAWNISPFVAMTIGGWCLGNAFLAGISARRWVWRLVYPSLIYLWLFGLFETGVVIAFADKLRLAHPIAWFYLAALGINLTAAAAGAIDFIRLRPGRDPFGPQSPPFFTGGVIAFVTAVGFLGLYGIIAQIGWPATGGEIFPEPMSLFTLRSFGVFYFALALSAFSLLFDRNMLAWLHHSFAAYGLIVAITAAAFVYIRLFDFAARPGGLLYIGAYLIVGVPFLFLFRRYGTGLGPADQFEPTLQAKE